ncbi:Na+/H+ antiporter subunit E [Corynebacterium kozikiae]|uniref:Na+/H+ antiporter subunit E n=1 Tax=Corynebacterium kozikiae TaxID=2968469 RepID=UPI00211CE57B|nr:Na+/H+ antiporter subunit E [Corynebacterium sp. 76QC2CO]MCQ9342747.1 Na+/H+ antiporter subunit E [Corynebacterium sp. 76QC2CO]
MVIIHVLRYFVWLTYQVGLAGWAVAKATLTGSKDSHPVILHYPLRVETNFLVTALAASITVTPATLSLGLKDGMLLVHAVFGKDHEGLFQDIAKMEETLAPSVRGKAHPKQWFVEDPAPAPSSTNVQQHPKKEAR